MTAAANAMQPLQASKPRLGGSAQPVRCWPSLKRHGSGRRAATPRALVDLVSSLAHVDLHHIAQHAPLAYEPIALPCSLQRCGDVVHRRWAPGAAVRPC